jgi:hypothetical protein
MGNNTKDPFDMINEDGKITKAELAATGELVELENKDKREDQQRRMAWVSMMSMIIFTLILFSPFVPADKVSALADLLSMFYVAQAGVVATFFGTQAFINTRT